MDSTMEHHKVKGTFAYLDNTTKAGRSHQGNDENPSASP